MSLKEQMLKAGLITEQQARQGSHAKRVDEKKEGHAGKTRRAENEREDARREADSRRTRDQKLNRQVEDVHQEKSRVSGERHHRRDSAEKAFRQGVLANWEGNRTYYFQDGNRVEFLKVSEETARRLERGQAAVARLAGGQVPYTVLQGAAAKTLLEVEPDRVVVLHQ